jgi:hypothetical protein
MGGFLPVVPNATSGKGIQGALQRQSGNLDTQTKGILGQRATETGSLIPGYQSLLNSGYSDQEKSAINQGTLGAINSSYGGAADAAGRRMARTGNSAGFGSFLGANTRGRASDLASQNLQNQKNFADETLRRKMMGLQGLQQLYGVDTSFLNSLNQGQGSLINSGISTYGIAKGHPGFLDTLGNSFAGSFGQAAGGLI